MTRRSAGGRPRQATRRWHIPPPLVHGPEPLEGGAVLEEVAGPPGLLLWRALRDVLLWAETPAAERGALFAPGSADRWRAELDTAALAVEHDVPLRAVAALVERPAEVRAADIAAACAAIAGRAEADGATATALAFAQNAALVDPSDPAAALEVARLAALRADHARTEGWLRRAVGIARQRRDWRSYTRAFAELGRLHRGRGNLPAAHRFHLRALRGARRGGFRSDQAVALHDLFAVAVEAGRAADAERLARLAFERYGARDPRVAVLAHDVAYHWMEQGRFARALPVIEAVIPALERPVERLWAEADLARAAAGAGDEARARSVAARVRQECRRAELAPGAPRALLEIGRALLQLGEPAGAEEAAGEALRLAGERREGRTRLMAEALLECARGAPRGERRTPAADEGGDALAREMAVTLNALHADRGAP